MRRSPELAPPDLPHTVNIDSNTYEAIPGVDASRRYITPRLVLQELSELQPTTASATTTRTCRSTT